MQLTITANNKSVHIIEEKFVFFNLKIEYEKPNGNKSHVQI